MKRYIRSNQVPIISEGWEYDKELDAYVQQADDYRAELYLDEGNVSGTKVRCDVYYKTKRLESRNYNTTEITQQLLDRADTFFVDTIYEYAASGEDDSSHKYAVDAFTDAGEPVDSTKYFDNSEDALRQWFYYGSKYPMNSMIQGKGTAEADIRAFCTTHPEMIKDMAERYNCPYKVDYLLEECRKPAKELNRLDQLHPFGLG